ncbi:MAG: hypothetical protein JSR66_17535 [Proteobacteria bacterium]|nr:hypothetical protein [Pseudomonadota bacterium]
MMDRATWIAVCLILSIAQSGCVTTSDTEAPQEYLDNETAATVLVAARPLVFARDRPELAVHMRDYVTLAAAAVDRMGKTDYVLIAYFWTTLDAHGREGESAMPGGADPRTRELIIVADDRRIRLRSGAVSAHDMGIGEAVHAPPSRAAIQVLYRVDLATLRFLSAAHHLALLQDVNDPTSSFQLWSDRRPALNGLVRSLNGQ